MKTKHFSSVIIATFFIISSLVVTSLSCSKSSNSNPPPGPTTTTLNISNMTFPATTSVKVGTTITWVNKDNFAHTVTANDGTFDGNVDALASFTYVTTKTGSFPYHCKIHSNMTATLTVIP